MASAADLEIYYASKYLVADDGTLTEQTADAGGSTTTIVDSALTEADDYWKGAILRWESDTTTVALRSTYAHVIDFVASTDTLTVASAMAAAPAAGDTYRLILGGNYRSSLREPGMTVSAGASAVTGVSILYASYLNGTNDGTLSFDASGTSLTYDPNGTESGAAVAVTDGTFNLFGSDTDNYITVGCTEASFSGTDDSDTITLSQPSGVIVPNMEGIETSSGKMRYYLLVAENVGSSTLESVKAYTEKDVSGAADTVTSQTKDTTAGTLTASSLTNWPTTGWVYNSTKDDCAYYHNKTGNTMSLFSRADACKLEFDSGGTTAIAVGDIVVGNSSGGSGLVMAVELTSGTWGAGNAVGILYMMTFNGTSYTNDEALHVSAAERATADGAQTTGYRGLTAQSWANGDTIKLMPAFDIGIDAPSTDQFENPTTESDQPAGIAFSAPITATAGLSIGDMGTAEIYGVWLRETAPVGAKAQSNIVSPVRLQVTI